MAYTNQKLASAIRAAAHGNVKEGTTDYAVLNRLAGFIEDHLGEPVLSIRPENLVPVEPDHISAVDAHLESAYEEQFELHGDDYF